MRIGAIILLNDDDTSKRLNYLIEWRALLNYRVVARDNPEFFHKQGVKIGVARRFADDIPLWLEDRENNDT